MKKVLSVYLKQYYGRMLNCQSSDESFLTYFTIILNAMIKDVRDRFQSSCLGEPYRGGSLQ